MSPLRGFLGRGMRNADEAVFRHRVRHAEAAIDATDAEQFGARMVSERHLPAGTWEATDASVTVVGHLHPPHSDWAKRAATAGELAGVRRFTDRTRGQIIVQVMTVSDADDAAAAVVDVPDTAVARAAGTVAMSRTLPPPVVAHADGAVAHELLLVGRVLWLTVAAHRGAAWVAVRSVGPRGSYSVAELSAVAAAQLAVFA